MASGITKLDKKLSQLKASKAKEEARFNDAVNKITDKYEKERAELERKFKEQIKEQKEINNAKIAELTPEINFYTKQRAQMLKLEKQLEQLNKANMDFANRKNTDADSDIEDESDESEIAEVEDATGEDDITEVFDNESDDESNEDNVIEMFDSDDNEISEEQQEQEEYVKPAQDERQGFNWFNRN